MYRPRICQNPKCCDTLTVQTVLPFCVSCRYIGRYYFSAGALLAGLIINGERLYRIVFP